MSADLKILGQSRPRHSVLDYSREEIIAFLKSKLADKKIIAAYLTGSLATDTSHHWSDIDCIIIKETNQPFLERGHAFQDLLELGIPVDILVYTPAEAENLQANPTPFWRQAMRQALRII